MLPELITWWTQQIGDLFAPFLNRVKMAVPDALLFAPGPVGISIQRRRKGCTEPVGIIPEPAPASALQSLLSRRHEPFVLALPSAVLICEATLPAAALGGLDRVLRYEMDRLTPFNAEDVFFTHRTLHVDRVRSTVRVELAFVPRARVQPALERLATIGAIPETLEAAAPDGSVRRISIARPDPARQSRDRSLMRLAVSVCVVLATAIVAVPLARQSSALSDIEENISALRPRVDQVDALRKRIAASSEGAGRIVAAREQARSTLQMLGVLTDTLPDDTWLSNLSLRQRSLVLEGHSTASTRLLAGMGAETRLRDPAFAAPVLRGDNGSEVFTIRTEFGS